MHPQRPDQDAPLAALLQQALAEHLRAVVDALARRVRLRAVDDLEENGLLRVVVPELSQNHASERPNCVFVSHCTFLVSNRATFKPRTP